MSDLADAPTQPRSRQETRIARNFVAFEHHLGRAQRYLDGRELAAAAVHCAVASHIAVQNHCGIFWSPRAEKILSQIGKSSGQRPAPRPRSGEIKRILQVGTQMASVGGLTKMLCEWVKADSGRVHALALTQQRGPAPEFVSDAFAAGGVTYLNRRPGGHIEWALRLREMARAYDLVILHTHCEDVTPLIAFAAPEAHTPVLILNHADHLFWFGPSICHLAINLRDAAQDLAIERRGIAPERNILMPTLSEAVVRTRSRETAKRELGVDPDAVLMVSVARRLKYRAVDGVTFPELHAKALEQHPNAMLYVVGAGAQDDWAPMLARFGDRIRSTPELPDPKIYFEAADLYVDSYPFVSSTSLMEAAGYGIPSVTIFSHPPAARIFGINHVALVGNVRQANSFSEYADILDQLIRDPGLRQSLAERARTAVAKAHNMPGWRCWLEAVYARAAELPPLDNRAMLEEIEAPHFGEPDLRHEDIFGGDWPTAEVVKSYMGMLPAHQRVAHWLELRHTGVFATPLSAASHTTLPEWLKRYVKDGLLARK